MASASTTPAVVQRAVTTSAIASRVPMDDDRLGRWFAAWGADWREFVPAAAGSCVAAGGLGDTRGRHRSQPAVRITGAPRVITSVCSWCADRLRSLVRNVQPSRSWTTLGEPALIIGSMVITSPSLSTSVCHGS